MKSIDSRVRNHKGHFVKGNRYQFDTETAQKAQRLSVRSRLRNQRRKMRKAVIRASAERDEWDALEKMYLGIVLEALDGNVKAAEYVSRVLVGDH